MKLYNEINEMLDKLDASYDELDEFVNKIDKCTEDDRILRVEYEKKIKKI